MVSLCILKEWHNLTDAELLGALEWHIRWQYALDIDLFQADIRQKTLHNFRALIWLNKKTARSLRTSRARSSKVPACR
ncbi:transposase [Thermodesulfobacteriota bacterium]